MTTVRVYVENHHIDISCGKGEQSFHWLAGVIQGRLKNFKILRKSMHQDTFIVTELRNQAGELINPKDKLYEHNGPAGLAVYASVATSFPVDDWENPIMNDWMQASHIHSSTGQQWTAEIDSWRRSLDEIKQQTESKRSSSPESKNNGSLSSRDRMNSNLLAQKVIPPSSSLIKVGYDFSEADVEAAFTLDWRLMRWLWLPVSDQGSLTRSKIGTLLKRHYSMLCNIFAHYAGVGKAGQRYGLTIQELSHLLHTAKLVNLRQTAAESDVEELFFRTAPEELQRDTAVSRVAAMRQQTSVNTNGGSSRWPLMTRAHMAEALVAVAQQTRDTDDGRLSLEESLRNLLEDPLTVFWDTITERYFLYSCQEDSLRAAFFEYQPLMRQVFAQRAVADSKRGLRLSVADFLLLVRDCTLIDNDRDQEQQATSATLKAQLNPPVQRELPQLVFAEFVEALSRLSLRAIDSYPGLTEAKKVRMSFNMVVELLGLDAASSNGGGRVGTK